jgi:hypothetical protein
MACKDAISTAAPDEICIQVGLHETRPECNDIMPADFDLPSCRHSSSRGRGAIVEWYYEALYYYVILAKVRTSRV